MESSGELGEDEKLSSTELFDSNNGEWHRCNNLPQPHYKLQSVIVNNILYHLGGLNKDGCLSPAVFTASLDTVLTTHQLKWNAYKDTPCCCFATVLVHGTHLLIVGGDKKIGNEHKRTSDIYKLNKIKNSRRI